MELRQLQYFQEVCRSGNFTRAAANLYTAQPGITHAIQSLEAELGVKLLNRNNKNVSLTPEGSLFLERVNRLLTLTEEITQEMRDLGQSMEGSLSLGVPPQIGAYLFPDLYQEFGQRYPNLTLNAFEQGSASTIALLEKGELDVGFAILPKETLNLNTHIISRQPIMLCISHEHRLCGRQAVNFSELKEEKFILRKADSFHREIVMNECLRHGFTPHVVFSSTQIQTIKSLVAKNTGIAFFMQMVVKDDPSIVSIPLEEPLSATIGLVWKKGKYISKAAQTFINFVIETVNRRFPE